jgi:hypothetical protein
MARRERPARSDERAVESHLLSTGKALAKKISEFEQTNSCKQEQRDQSEQNACRLQALHA